MKAKLIISFFLPLFASFALKVQAQVNSFQFYQLDSLQRTAKKPVVVFIHTDWCRYCGSMKNITLKEDSVAALLNENFYFISFNAETKDDVVFDSKRFKYRPTGPTTGIHDLAIKLGIINGRLSYPTLCFLDSDYKILLQQPGYIRPAELTKILTKLTNQ